ncbi:hypothetical protein CAEBREN_21559 [Caenorhabditis brenneri]|uniref:Uncharacterized protein n=1 Tax=Caenorhabditis brenneri TaxID=135651 RepID=G0MAL0_CAEBE|nr:hypothetical protein CAEBREN_21559 [Caenorhabditis brenneri]
MTDFYITLVSNAQSDSTISNFKTNLPSPINLNRAYEVALSSIIYPTSHDLISRNKESQGNYENEFFVHYDKKIIKCRVPNCSFSTPEELLEILNKTLSTALKTATNDPKLEFSLFSYDKAFKRVICEKKEKVTLVEFSERLCYFLGLGRTCKRFPEYGTYSMFSGTDLMYIYSDGLVEPQTVSHMKVPLLKIISITSKNVGNIEQSFTNPLYVPVRCNYISQIGIQIKNDRNHFIPFNSGKIVIVLHFRPITNSLDG